MKKKPECKRRIRRKSLFVDAYHGEQATDGRAFGFIGTKDINDYQGWFFTWPSHEPVIRTEGERRTVLASLEADLARPDLERIPDRWAQRALAKYLERHFRALDKEV